MLAVACGEGVEVNAGGDVGRGKGIVDVRGFEKAKVFGLGARGQDDTNGVLVASSKINNLG